MKVIFIISLSHSGSTLLDLMLNAHPEVISVGELKQLNRFARMEKPNPRSNRCTCGAKNLWSCPLWSEVNAIAEKGTGRNLGELNVEDYEDKAGFDRDNVVLFNAIAKASGKKYIVDSSKQWQRLELLIANPKIDVFPVLLIRDPKGQISSSIRKHKTSLGILIHRYVRANRAAYALVKRIPHAVVQYESLVRNPEETLRVLMQQIGLDFDRQQLEWARERRHNVGGNRMRWRKENKLKLDETWRKSLSMARRFAINVGTLPGRLPLVKLGFR